MSVISGTIGAILGAQSQEDAANKNQQNVQQTNAQNYKMFEESRGSNGSAVLPLYLKGKDGGLFESQLGNDLVDSYDAVHQDPTAQLGGYQATMDRFNPMREQATSTAQGIFNGGVQKQMFANAQPVQQARVNYSRQTAVDALNKTLGDIAAVRAGKGYTGDSMGDRLLTLKANEDEGNAVANANLQNLQENEGIKNQALQLQLQNLNLPYSLAQNELAFQNMPEDTYLSELQKEQDPLKFLYMGPGTAFKNQNLPTVNPISGAAQLALQSTSGLGNTALNYWLQSQLASQYAAGAGAGAGYGASAGVGAGADALDSEALDSLYV